MYPMDVPSASSLNADPILAGFLIAAVLPVALLLRRGVCTTPRNLHWVALAAATALLAVAWLSPLGTTAQHYLVSAHLLQITMVMGGVAPLLLLALPRYPRIHPPALVVKTLRVLVHPAFAIVAVNAAFFGWHMSAPFDAAVSHPWIYDLQQLSLLLASLAFWWPIVTPFSPPVRAMSPLGKLGYILLATIPQTFGGLAVALAHRVLYAAYGEHPRVLGLDPMTDQQIAGASIALLSKVALLAAFVILFLRLLASTAPETGDDGGGGGGGSPRINAPRPLPSGTPRWLEELEAGRTVPEPSMSPEPVREPATAAPGRG